MSAELPEFSLVRDPWIRCIMADGSLSELSLWDVFERRDQIRRIAGELSTQDYAILRLLLAILYSALPVPDMGSIVPEWTRLRENPSELWEPVAVYLESVESRFQLFDPVVPFMQVAALRTSTEKYDGVTRLIADVPSGYQYFTTRAGKALQSMEFAEAARWLVHVNAFDASGIKSGAVNDDRVKGGRGYPIGTGWVGSTGGVFFEGDNLGETLLLNLDLKELAAETALDDFPLWEREPVGPWEERPGERPMGPADVLTWPSRRVRLIPSGGRVTQVMVSNGDKLAPQNMTSDPYTAYRYSKPQSAKLKTAVYMPKEHDPERTLWNGIGSLMVQGTYEAVTETGERLIRPPRVVEWVSMLVNYEALPKTRILNVRLIGMLYGTQSSVVNDVIDDSLPIHLGVLTDRAADISQVVRTAVAETDNAIWALGTFAGELSIAAGGAPEPPRDAIRQRAFFAIDAPFRQWVSGLTGEENADEVRQQWNAQARAILHKEIDQALQFAGTAAIVGRVTAGHGFVSAATAENRVLHKLRATLPLAAETERKIAMTSEEKE